MGHPIRERFIDYDARREPRTGVYCMCCQRDLDPRRPHRMVWTRPGQPFAIHPDDIDRVPDRQAWRIGLDCAKRLGLDWTTGPADT